MNKRSVIRAAATHEPTPSSTMMQTTPALTYQDTNRTFPNVQNVTLYHIPLLSIDVH